MFAPDSAPAWLRGLAGVPPSVLAFALACFVGAACVFGGALFEARRVRREAAEPGGGNLVTGSRQLFWRLASAVVWCLALALLGYACSWGWPRLDRGLGLDGRSFLRVVGTAMSLFLVGLLVLASDLRRVRARARVQQAAFEAGLSRLAQQEIERATAGAAPRKPLP